MFALQAQSPNWAEDVAPILYQQCTPCHHTGGLAPFSLMTYGDAAGNANGVYDAVDARRMPPWPPNPDYQNFAHERLLNTNDINTIKTWVQNGAIQGNAALAPAPPTYNNLPTITAPDLVVTMPNYTVSGNADIYRCFAMPSNLNVQNFITGMEVIPGNPEIVHHVLIFADTTNQPNVLDAADPGPGWTSFGNTGSNASELIGTWVPGTRPVFYPSGMGVRLAPNAKIIFQVHYPTGSNGKSDQTSVRFKLTGSPSRPLYISAPLNHGSALVNGPLVIPANQTKVFQEKYKVPLNISVLEVGPHMHLIGKSIKSYGVTPLGDTLKFIDIPNWDFHWQGGYMFKKIMKVPVNTWLWAEALYDNTTANIHNPSNPPQLVTAGEATTNEMMMVFFTYTYYLPGDENIVLESPITGIGSGALPIKMACYPNPSTLGVYIQVGEEIKKGYIRLMDEKGALVKEWTQENMGNAPIYLNVEDIPQGHYYFQVEGEGKMGAMPWVKI